MATWLLKIHGSTLRLPIICQYHKSEKIVIYAHASAVTHLITSGYALCCNISETDAQDMWRVIGTLSSRWRRWQRWVVTLAGGQAGRRMTNPMGSAWLRVSHACSNDASGDSDGTPKAAHAARNLN